MEKINIAELLKDCPKGMELDCINYDGVVTFEEIFNCPDYPIKITVKYNNECVTHTLTKYGQTCISPYNKCIIFPKGKTTWEGFVPSCQFKDGDIITTNLGSVFILKTTPIDTFGYNCYVALNDVERFIIEKENFAYRDNCRFATEEEKEKLFKAIKDNGYKWNPETKTLEKLIEPKFKVGDRIRKENNNSRVYTINGVYSSIYGIEERDFGILIEEQDEWELVPNKFDISNLKPFDKVLYRMHDKATWCNSFYCFYKSNHHFVTYLTIVRQCIPYEGNEHLLGTTNDCDDFYKTWEE